MSSITTSAIDTPSRRSVERTCDDLAIIVLAAVALIASLTFRDYGLGWDDYTHAEYADLLLRMYGSGFKDTGALSFANLYMYGGGFDMVAALLHKVIPLELFETRRLLGAFVGVIGLAVTWRLGRPVDRFAHPWRARAPLCLCRLHAAVPGGNSHAQRARGCSALRPCCLRAAARPGPRLPRDGADLAVVDHGAGQSLPRADVLLALLREAMEGNVRWRAGVSA